MKASVIGYCARLGKDSSLVQGAGGNVSWKDHDTLWVKASGTWLANAEHAEIFVPVALSPLREALSRGDFDVAPQVIGTRGALRPSIETLLHALMPQRVVVHLHAVEVLTHLVQDGHEARLRDLVGDSFAWATVGYHKPGPRLAQAVRAAVTAEPCPSVLFLANHGVVIGGEDVATVDAILTRLVSLFATSPRDGRRPACPPEPVVEPSRGLTFIASDDAFVQQLATHPECYARLARDWALYPDHVVFLGPEAFAFEARDDFLRWMERSAVAIDVAFVRDVGVFIKREASPAVHAQLRCYADILSRLPATATTRPLSAREVAELIDWDAETYRASLARSSTHAEG